MARLEALRQLSAALSGRPALHTDWPAVLDLANEALVTPQLHAALVAGGMLERLPSDARTFTAEVFRRNRDRNRRLFCQLRDAVAALNAAGIEPVLLKGAALWVSLGRPRAFDRMLNDLDLLVQPAEANRAVEALASAGFEVLARYEEPWRHVVAELGRPTDVGVIDLHWRPPGPSRSAMRPEGGRRVAWERVHAIVPDAADQVFMLALHDQFHEGGYWRGDLCVRHLLDIATLAPQADWTALDRLAGRRLTRRAVAVQIEAARRFGSAESPWPPAGGRWVRLHHVRRLVQFAWPATVWPLACLAALSEAASLLGRGRLVGDGPGWFADRLARFLTLVGSGTRTRP